MLGTRLVALLVARASASLGGWAVPLGQLGLLAAAVAHHRRALPGLGSSFERSAAIMRSQMRS